MSSLEPLRLVTAIEILLDTGVSSLNPITPGATITVSAPDFNNITSLS